MEPYLVLLTAAFNLIGGLLLLRRTQSTPCPRKHARSAWCPYCYSNTRGRSNYPGHSHYRITTKIHHYNEDTYMKRPTPAAESSAETAPVLDEKATKKFPGIMDYLASTVYEDGTARERSTLSIFVEDGCFKIALNDKDLKRSAYLTSQSLEGVFQGLEQAIQKGGLDWRLWGKNTKKK